MTLNDLELQKLQRESWEQWLKELAIQEFQRRGMTGVFRWYYGKKEVIEWDGQGFDAFWKIWKADKALCKSLGFGVWKDEKCNRYIIFCEINEETRVWLWKKWQDHADKVMKGE